MAAQLALFGSTRQTTPVTETKFDQFWRNYPRRSPYPNPKKPAQDKFDRLVRKEKVDPDEIIAGVVAYAKVVEGSDPRFVVMAATFLNQHRWKCDYTQPDNCGSGYAEFARKLAGHGHRNRQD